MSLALALTLLVSSGAYSYFLLRGAAGLGRLLALLLGQLGVLAVPWLIPLEETVFRFIASLAAALAFMRMWESYRGSFADPRVSSTFSLFMLYYTSVPEISVLPETDRMGARHRGASRLLRAAARLSLLGGFFVVSTIWPLLHEITVLHLLWCLFAAYVAASAAVDLAAGAGMLLSGHRAEEVFCSPPLARSPRDFWGKRWNLMFRNTSHRLIFEPLRGTDNPLVVVMLVFLWSALLHEYLVFATLGHSRGHMLAFFLAHGAATVLTGAAAKRWRQFRLPEPMAVGLHWGWMLATAPLFFEPIKQILPAHAIRLW